MLWKIRCAQFDGAEIRRPWEVNTPQPLKTQTRSNNSVSRGQGAVRAFVQGRCSTREQRRADFYAVKCPDVNICWSQFSAVLTERLSVAHSVHTASQTHTSDQCSTISATFWKPQSWPITAVLRCDWPAVQTWDRIALFFILYTRISVFTRITEVNAVEGLPGLHIAPPPSLRGPAVLSTSPCGWSEHT